MSNADSRNRDSFESICSSFAKMGFKSRIQMDPRDLRMRTLSLSVTPTTKDTDTVCTVDTRSMARTAHILISLPCVWRGILSSDNHLSLGLRIFPLGRQSFNLASRVTVEPIPRISGTSSSRSYSGRRLMGQAQKVPH